MIEAIVATKRLTNWRVKRVFDLPVIEQMKYEWDDSENSKERAEEMVAAFLDASAPNPDTNRPKPNRMFHARD